MAPRTEKDFIGEIQVPENVYWGAQTQRSVQNFNIGDETMPIPVIRAFGYLKKSGSLSEWRLRSPAGVKNSDDRTGV